MKRDLNTLTVGELKELLENYDDETPVVFTYGYGDHWHTTVFGRIVEADLGQAEYSDYHEMFKESEDSEEETIEVLVLQ